MCSISGCINFKNELNEEDRKIIQQILWCSQDRGRDSFGYTTFLNGLVVEDERTTGNVQNYFKKNTIKYPFSILMANTRAEPTTEYIARKKKSDVQPYTNNTKEIFIVHNGTIANDKELEKQYNLKRKTKIDSAIIPLVLQEKACSNIKEYGETLRNDLIGSYALAIYDLVSPEEFYLATNYKPLYIMRNMKTGTIFFTSLEDYFNMNSYNTLFDQFKIMEVKPYTILRLTKDKIESDSLYKIDHKLKGTKALVICSAGLDSTVCASWAKRQGHEITLLHYHYGARANNAEDRAIKKIAKRLDCDLVEINTDIFKNVIKHSRLTNPNEEGDLVKTNEGEASAELAWEWVPARNLIFMSIAAGYAEAYGFDYIILGGNLEESGAYADNELIFQRKFNNLLPNALNLQNKVEVLTPVANLMKHEIVKLGLDIGAPLDLTWSCYENGTVHCGMCGPCMMRRMGFKMNGIKDMIQYKQLPKGFWEDIKNGKEKGKSTKTKSSKKRRL